MATIADELNAISVEHGYTGAAPKTIADAIDALADTLAGEDIEERRTIAGAIHALAPYIGGGGGGGFEPGSPLGIMVATSSVLNVPEGEYFLFCIDSRGPLQSMQDINSYGNVYRGVSTLDSQSFRNFGIVGGGLYVALAVTIDAAGDADKVQVHFSTNNIEDVMRFVAGNNVIISFQVPESDLDADIIIRYGSSDDDN